jgi:hypothetical protein
MIRTLSDQRTATTGASRFPARDPGFVGNSLSTFRADTESSRSHPMPTLSHFCLLFSPDLRQNRDRLFLSDRREHISYRLPHDGCRSGIQDIQRVSEPHKQVSICIRILAIEILSLLRVASFASPLDFRTSVGAEQPATSHLLDFRCANLSNCSLERGSPKPTYWSSGGRGLEIGTHFPSS